MKIALNEIWNFLDLMEKKEEGWIYAFQAGDVFIEGLSTDTMQQLKEDDSYDTELLPSLFTFREILWQPDVFTEAGMSLPSLRVLKAYCEETAQELATQDSEVNKIYIPLIKGLGNCSAKAGEILESDKKQEVKKVLGDFRTAAFPIIKFFINHPQNRTDYHRDAVNRLNYFVKIMLTQFYGRYTALADPYWLVTYTHLNSDTKVVSTER